MDPNPPSEIGQSSGSEFMSLRHPSAFDQMPNGEASAVNFAPDNREDESLVPGAPAYKVRWPLEEESEDPLIAFVKGYFTKTAARTKAKYAAYRPLDWLGYFIPCVTWLRTYNVRSWLLWDLAAGVAVAAMVVPQGISYSKSLAGLPSVFGLYGAFVPCWVYAIFGSSRQLAVGPVAVTSLLLHSSLTTLPLPADVNSLKLSYANCPKGTFEFDSATGKNVTVSLNFDSNTNPDKPCSPDLQDIYNTAAIQIAFIAGLMYTAVGLLNLGWLTNFLSMSVLTGFTTGASVIIGYNQFRYFLGISSLVQQGNDIIQQSQLIKNGFDNGASVNYRDVLMFTAFLAILVIFKEVGKRIPKLVFFRAIGPLFVTMLSIAIVAWGGLASEVSTVGKLKSGLPPWTPSLFFPLYDAGKQIPLAVLICAIDIMESYSIAKALAIKNKYELIPNRELRGLGFANIAGSFFSCYTTTGSFSRSAVNNDCGAKTGLSCFTTGTVVMFVLLFATSWFKNMPKSAQGAIVTSGIISLFNWQEWWFLWKVNKVDWLVFTVCFLVTILADVEIGLVTAIGLAIAIVVLKSGFPHTAVLGRLPKSNVFRNVRQYPDDIQEYQGILVVRVDAPIYFANVQPIQDHIRKYRRRIEESGDVLEYIVIDLSPVSDIDATAVHFLNTLIDQLNDDGIQLCLANPSRPVTIALNRAGLHNKLGRDWVFVNTAAAVDTCLLLQQKNFAKNTGISPVV